MTAETSPRLSPSGRRLPETPASFVPLSSVIWVDGATVVPLAEQNGFIGTPFATLAAGFAPLADGDVLNLVPMGSTSYGNLTVSKSVCIQSASLALEQLGNSAIAVRPTVTAVDGLTVSSGQVLACTGLSIGSLSLDPDGTANALLSQCDLHGISSLAGGFAQLWNCQTTAEADFFSLICANTTFGGLVRASAIVATDSNFDGIQAGAGSAALTLTDCTAQAVVCGPSTFADCSIASIDCNDDCTITDTAVSGAVTVGGNATIFTSQLSGGLTVTGNLTIDGSSYTYALQHGSVAVTGSLNVTSAPYGKAQKQLAWNPASAANSNVLTLLPAGHAPGIYVVNSALIIQAVATAATALSRLISFNAPGGGAQTFSQSIFGAATIWTLSTPPAFSKGNTAAYSAQSTAFTLLGSNIVSDGSQPITLQFVSSGFTGTPSVDVYGSVDLVGYL